MLLRFGDRRRGKVWISDMRTRKNNQLLNASVFVRRNVAKCDDDDEIINGQPDESLIKKDAGGVYITFQSSTRNTYIHYLNVITYIPD